MVKKPARATPKLWDLSVKVTLAGTKPPIWRRIVTTNDTTLQQLHVAIQAVMGWHSSHLHSFSIGGDEYGDLSQLEDANDEDLMCLDDLVKDGISRFTYVYDFGDDWEHNILIEKAKPKTTNPDRPCCVAGARNSPPEDCGGIEGYQIFVAALADPNHPEHQSMKEWYTGDFDPEAFTVEGADARLGRMFSRSL